MTCRAPAVVWPGVRPASLLGSAGRSGRHRGPVGRLGAVWHRRARNPGRQAQLYASLAPYSHSSSTTMANVVSIGSPSKPNQANPPHTGESIAQSCKPPAVKSRSQHAGGRGAPFDHQLVFVRDAHLALVCPPVGQDVDHQPVAVRPDRHGHEPANVRRAQHAPQNSNVSPRRHPRIAWSASVMAPPAVAVAAARAGASW